MQVANERTSLTGGGDTKMRSLQAASAAYGTRDAELSRLAHDVKICASSPEAHNHTGDSIKSVVFGGLDGILTSFAIVAGAAGGQLSPEVVLVLGISNILADALSMGVGEHLSSKAHNEFVMMERLREEWEMKQYPAGEIEEMIDLYQQRGMSREDADVVINRMAKYPEFFVDVMMVEELGLQVPDEDENTVKDGFVMFLSFAFFGFLPLIGYVMMPLLFPEYDFTEHELFLLACVVTSIALFALGAIKAMFSHLKWWVSGGEMLLLGSVCACIAYTTGYAVGSLIEH